MDGVARTLADPAVLVSSSDAGAHMQMLCASGDTTLLLTRHVRDRGDMTLEHAVHELTGRQAEVFGFADRGVVAPGAIADLAVFALDELHYDKDEFVHDLPAGGAWLRRPEGGYRATVVDGVCVQTGGTPTGRPARPGPGRFGPGGHATPLAERNRPALGLRTGGGQGPPHGPERSLVCAAEPDRRYELCP
ncbi:amidohydrolase family protein [Yinghuangia aomiensis]